MDNLIGFSDHHLVWNRDLPRDMFKHIKSFLPSSAYITLTNSNKAFQAYLIEDQSDYNTFLFFTVLKVKVLVQDQFKHQDSIDFYSLGCKLLQVSLEESIFLKQKALNSINNLDDNQSKADGLINLAEQELYSDPQKAKKILELAESLQEKKQDGSNLDSIVRLKILKFCLDPNNRINNLLGVFNQYSYDRQQTMFAFTHDSEDSVSFEEYNNFVLIAKALLLNEPEGISTFLQNFSLNFQVQILSSLSEDPHLSSLKEKLLVFISKAIDPLQEEEKLLAYCELAGQFRGLTFSEKINFLNLAESMVTIDPSDSFSQVKLANTYIDVGADQKDTTASREAFEKALQSILKINDSLQKNEVLSKLINAYSKIDSLKAHQLCAYLDSPIHKVKTLCEIAVEQQFQNISYKNALIKDALLTKSITKQNMTEYKSFTYEATRLTNYKTALGVFKDALLFIETNEITEEFSLLLKTFPDNKDYQNFLLKIVRVLSLNSSILTIKQLKILFSSINPPLIPSVFISRLLPDLFHKNPELAHQLYDYYLKMVIDSDDKFFQEEALKALIENYLPTEKKLLIALLNVIHQLEKNRDYSTVWITLVKKLSQRIVVP